MEVIAGAMIRVYAKVADAEDGSERAQGKGLAEDDERSFVSRRTSFRLEA